MALPAPAIPGYTQTTQTQALAALSERLEDLANTYWSLAELRLYLAEAVRTWQAYTGWYRSRITLPVPGGVNWYDIGTYSVTDADTIGVLLYHLLETQLAAGAWTGTGQFDLAVIQAALRNRVDRYLSDTGVVSTRIVQDAGTITNGRVLLTPSIIDVRRVSWVAGGSSRLLWRDSEWGLNAHLRGWLGAPGPPKVYSVAATPPVSLQLAPPPGTSGTLDLVAVKAGPALTLAPSILGIPDDLAWGVKWGVLADLLSRDGQAKDPARAVYCEQRYREAVELAALYPSIAQTIINGVPVFTGSVFDLDAYSSGWENLAAGVPVAAGLVGRNLLAFAPAPVNGVSVILDLIVDIPVPAADSDYLQVPPDVIAVVLDYAQHLASFKMGGNEFVVTDQQRTNLLYEAAKYNSRLRQTNFYNSTVRNTSGRLQDQVPRLDLALSKG